MVTSTYEERLRRLAINASNDVDTAIGIRSPSLDAKILALARLAALIAVGGSEPSFAEHTAAAIAAGATTDEIVDLLAGIGLVVGTPRVVSAAAEIAIAFGIDAEQIFG